jgi:hypothetical protein
VSDLQSTLDAIDRVLAECNARDLPPLGVTCLRRYCTNSVTPWLSPYYCSEKCRATATVTDFTKKHLDVHLTAWQEAMVALTFGVRPQPPPSLDTAAAEATAGAAVLANLGVPIRDRVDPVALNTPMTRGWLDRWIRRHR